MHTLSPWLLVIRPKTLLVAIAVILLGQEIALYDQPDTFSYSIALLCLLCCMALQIAVNLANDFFDDKNGVDGNDRLGPVRAIQKGQITPRQIAVAIFITCFIAICSGIYLIILGGWPYVLLGLLSLAGVYLYSGGPKPIASAGLGEFAVFLYFGWLAVVGSYYLQTQFVSWQIFIAASEIGLLVAAIMLVNNIRDIDTDGACGKFTLATRLGLVKSQCLYCLLLLLPSLLLLVDTHQGMGMLLLLPVQLVLCVLIFRRTGSALNAQLGQTSACVLLWALVYGTSLMIGSS